MPRREERLSYHTEVALEFSSGTRVARISDISSGGCYIDSIAQVPIGDPLTLQIRSRDGSTIVISGKVAYILDGFGFGVEFVDVTEEQRLFVAHLMGSTTE